MTEIVCTACGAPIPENQNFCINCGAKAPVAPPLPPVATAEPQPGPQAPAAEPAPLRFLDYLIMVLVFSVPLAGTVIASMWAFGWAIGKPAAGGKKPKKNRRDLALAQFIVKAAFLLAFLVFYFINFSAMNEFFKVMLS